MPRIKITNRILQKINKLESLIPAKKKVLLSEREKQIIKLICLEHSCKEIGKIIGLSGKTIENITTELIARTESKNRIGLVIYAVKNKIYKVK